MKNNKKKNNRGFTLIELLVVIAIVGLLSSVIMVNLNSARAKGRDAKRLSEIRNLQSALELYYDDNGHYPYGCGTSSPVGTATLGYAAWSSFLSSTYIGSMPLDPINTPGGNTVGPDGYAYYYCVAYKPIGKCSFVQTAYPDTYILGTRLENPSASSQSCPGVFSGWDNLSLNYLVGVGQ